MSLHDDSRAMWSARANTWSTSEKAANTVPAGERIGVSYHYPGAATLGITPASPHSACLSRVRTWQDQHQAKGWADIGYNSLICQHARAIEGRGVQFKGAHSPGVNWGHYGVQFMVSNGTPPTPAMYARAVRLRADLEARSGRRLRQWGHQDDPAAATLCPGTYVEKWVKSGGPYAATPTPTPTPTQEDPVTPTEIQAVASAVVDKLATRYDDGTTLVGRLLWGYKNTSAGATRDAYADLRGLGPAIAELGGQVALWRADLDELDDEQAAAVYQAARQAILDTIASTLEVTITAGPPTVAEPSTVDPHELPAVTS